MRDTDRFSQARRSVLMTFRTPGGHSVQSETHGSARVWNSPSVQAETNAVPTLFITGAPGSGKTALAKEVSELLWRVHRTSCSRRRRRALPGRAPGRDVRLQSGACRREPRRSVDEFRACRGAAARPGQGDPVGRGSRPLRTGDSRLRPRRVSGDRATLDDRRPNPTARGGVGRVVPRARLTRELDVEIARLDLPGFVVENGDARSIGDLALEVLERIDWPRPLRAPG